MTYEADEHGNPILPGPEVSPLADLLDAIVALLGGTW